jgi:hypothetical protein
LSSEQQMNERMLIGLAIIVLSVSSCHDNPTSHPWEDASHTPSRCSDGVQDEAETDVDCGGPMCHRCSGAKSCQVSTDCFSGNCLAPQNKCSALTNVTFADPVSYASGFKTYVMMSGDIVGNGKIDLAAANEEGNAVAVFRNLGSGVFARVMDPTSSGFPTGEYPTGGTIADFNKDGVADIITADYHGNSVTILLGSGVGDTYTLGAPTSYPTVAGAETSNLAVGDLNHDGHLDVIATNPQTASVSVFMGNLDGALAPATNIAFTLPDTTDLPEPYSVVISDFDGDGRNDAAIADNRSGTVFIQLGNGDGTFHAGSRPHINAAGGYRMIGYDLDVDGHLDLVTISSDNEVSVLLGNGDGTFRDGVTSPTGPGTGPYTVAVADFNLDGVPDVITANYMTSNASLLLGIGDGTFEAPIDAGMMGMCPYGIAAGDFNGDGKPDFATANACSNDVTVRMNTGQ